MTKMIVFMMLIGLGVGCSHGKPVQDTDAKTETLAPSTASRDDLEKEVAKLRREVKTMRFEINQYRLERGAEAKHHGRKPEPVITPNDTREE